MCVCVCGGGGGAMELQVHALYSTLSHTCNANGLDKLRQRKRVSRYLHAAACQLRQGTAVVSGSCRRE
jgi:hypothetical protein